MTGGRIYQTHTAGKPIHGNRRRRGPRPSRVVAVCLLIAFLGSFAVLTLVKLIAGVPNASLPALYTVGKGVAIFDRNDKYVTTIYADKDRKPVPLSQVSPFMKSAVLAAEDHNFYQHHGIDPVGICRALVSNLHAGRVVEGGSTITQQLVRNLYLDIDDRSMKRKLAEAVLAFDVENKYSKQKILETYLNEVYFGSGVYGIERAAQVYFNKSASKLTLPECAFIAGLIKAPSDLGSGVNRDAALRRQQEVIDKMAMYGLISRAQADQAKSKKLRFATGQPASTPFPYYMNYVLATLRNDLSEDQIWGKGIKVKTNLDPAAQQAAERMLNKGINAAPHGINQGALVCESVRDGAVLAMVGGVGSYRNHQWNRAIYPHTVGSTFKPFVYLTGLMTGVLRPESTIDDAPLTINQGFGAPPYSPKNFDGRFLGTITVRDALALSRNVCAVRVGQAAGPDNVIKTARAAGITSPMNANLSISLGSCAVSPMEMASAYGTLARYGVYISPQVVREVDGPSGQPIKIYQQTKQQTLPQEQVCQLVDVLQDVVQHGTGTQAKLANVAVAGKTGTADKARDIWFVGFTPDTVTAVWGGNDRNLPVGGSATGGTVMAAIWHSFMQSFYTTHPAPKEGFIPPSVALTREASARLSPQIMEDAREYDEGVKQPANENQDPTDQQSSTPQQGGEQEQDQTAAPQETPAAPPVPRVQNYNNEPLPQVQQVAPNTAPRQAEQPQRSNEEETPTPNTPRQTGPGTVQWREPSQPQSETAPPPARQPEPREQAPAQSDEPAKDDSTSQSQ